MAIYHASTKPISRSAGRSATAAAAYRAGVRLIDLRTGEIHDYRKKRGVLAAGIVLPGKVNGTKLREQLWNAAEKAEKRKDGRVAREWVVALPDELDAKQRSALAARFAQKLVERYGVAADLAVHAPSKAGDQRNHHAHILLTTRRVNVRNGVIELGEKASIELSNKARKERGLGPAADDVKEIRALWAELTNAALHDAGHEARIDHRSHAELGIDDLPGIHLGPAATEIERRTQLRSKKTQRLYQRMQEYQDEFIRIDEELFVAETAIEREIISLKAQQRALEALPSEERPKGLAEFKTQLAARSDQQKSHLQGLASWKQERGIVEEPITRLEQPQRANQGEPKPSTKQSRDDDYSPGF